MTDELLGELLAEVRALRGEVAAMREATAADDMKQFCINVAANALWECMEENERTDIKNAFKK